MIQYAFKGKNYADICNLLLMANYKHNQLQQEKTITSTMRTTSNIIILLAVMSYVLQESISLKLDHIEFQNQSQNQQQRIEEKKNWNALQWTWYQTEYLLDDVPQLPKDYSIGKQEWKRRYQSVFQTPEWLTEQKFLFCDWNNNSIIEKSEVKCF